MKFFRLLLVSVVLLGSLLLCNFIVVNAGFFDTDKTSVLYCQNGECSFSNGVKILGTGINDIVTGKKFSVYVQDVIVYLLTFVSLIGVIYIIYAGVQLLTSGGNEEHYKKTKNIIIYVIIGIVVMWLAYPIMKWIIAVVSHS